MKIIKLDNEELFALKPIYEKMICPQKCHVLEKRIWFVPKKLLENTHNIDYTCCIRCYYNKKYLDLLNGKYKKEDLVPIFAENLNCNCDESEDFDFVSIKLNNDMRIGIYCQDYNNLKHSIFLQLKEKNNIEITAVTPIIKGNISIVIYKNLKDTKLHDDTNSVLLGKAYDDSVTIDAYNDIVKHRFLRAYIQNGEYCLTINDISKIKTNKMNIIYKNTLIDYNFYNKQEYNLILEYFISNDMETIQEDKIKLLINLHYIENIGDIRLRKDIFTDNLENNYNKKNLEI